MGRDERAASQAAIQQRAQAVAVAERMIGDPHPFDTFAAGCPKCGSPKEAQKPNYCFGDQPLVPDLPCKVKGEHHHVACTVCNFVWLQRCADWKEGDEPSALVTP